MSYHSWFFFFQAEDGIRDVAVTGVQTCALPISYFVQSERRTRMNQLEKDDNATCVMTYSHDGFGLGHLRRNTTIASILAHQVPDSSVLMMIGCPSGAVFRLPTGVDFIKLPSVVKRHTGVWLPLRLRIGLEKTKALRVATIHEAVRVFHPQILLVDHEIGRASCRERV